MRIQSLVVTPFVQNARILIDETSRQAFVVDPGGDVSRIVAAIDALDVEVVGIILTHSHIDHAGGVAELERQLGARKAKAPKLYAHKAEKAMRSSIAQQAIMFGLSPDEYENVREPDILVDHGDSITLGQSTFTVLFTPGHSPGHVSFYCAEPGIVEFDASDYSPKRQSTAPILIGGDAIFGGAIGRTDLPGGNSQTLLKSIREQIFTLPPDTLILPGHGGDTTVGVERDTNPFFQ